MALLMVLMASFMGAAQGAPEGLIITGTASGKTMTYNDPDAPIPATPSMEAHEAFTLATFDSGPSAHGLSSIFWPGSAGANFGPVYGLPAYPVRAETFYPKGPEKDSNKPGPPGMSMQAEANEALASASAVTGKEDGSPGALARRLSASVVSFLQEDVGVSEGTATVKDLSIADGLLTIDSVVTEARITSDGDTAKVTGKTKVAGVQIADQFEATIDEKGLHINEETVTIPDVFGEGPVKEALDAAGFSVKVARPITEVKGGSASTELGGLVVRFDGTAFKEYLAPLPKEVREEIEKNVDFRKDFVYRFGSVSLGVDASDAGFELPDVQVPDTDLPAPDAPVTAGGGPVGGIPALGGGGGDLQVDAPPDKQPLDPVPAAAPAPDITSHPLPAILLAATLAAALGLTRVMKGVADQLVLGGGTACPHKDVD